MNDATNPYATTTLELSGPVPMARARTLYRKALPFAILGLLVAYSVYRAAWYVPSPIVGN